MNLSKHFLKIILPIHILTMTLFLFFDTNWYLILIGWILISGFGIAIGFHRYFSHKNFKTYKIFHFLMIFLGCLGGQGSPIFWAALHRGLHHRYADSKKDIHSPKNGILKSYILWQIQFDPKTLPTFAAKDLTKDKIITWSHIYYNKIIWITIFCLSFISCELLLNLLLLPMIISMHQENIINVFCHIRKLGYRNFNTQDNSVNNWLLGFLFWGHGFHNNHHANPHIWNYGIHWWEIDLCKYIVPFLIRKNFQYEFLEKLYNNKILNLNGKNTH